MLHALLILLEFCRKTNGHYVVFAIKLRIEPQELSQYVAIVLLLICFGKVNVTLLHLEEANDEHEETIRSQTSMPRLVQPIDLQHLLENKHKWSQYWEFFFVGSDHVNDLDACMFHVILRIMVVDNITHINHKVLLIHVFILLLNFNALIVR